MDAKVFMKVTGKRLKDARKAAGWGKARDFAAAAGVNIGTLSVHENGRRQIPPLTAAKYEQTLDLKSGSLLQMDDNVLGVSFGIPDLVTAVCLYYLTHDHDKSAEDRAAESGKVFQAARLLLEEKRALSLEDAVELAVTLFKFERGRPDQIIL